MSSTLTPSAFCACSRTHSKSFSVLAALTTSMKWPASNL